MRGSRSLAVGLSSIFALLAACGQKDSGNSGTPGFGASGSASSGGSQSSESGSATSTGDSSGAGSDSSSGGGSGNADGTIVSGITGGAGSGSDAGSITPREGGLCGTTHVTATTETNVLVVVDRSYSMTESPSGFTTNKWSALVQALPAALMTVQDSVAFGLEFFPTPGGGGTGGRGGVGGGIGGGAAGGAGSCTVATGAAGIQVPVGPGTMTVPQISAALQNNANGPGSPIGFTPTADALQTALTYFTTGAGASLMGDKFVLLATDGGPNCNSNLTCDADHCTMNLDNQCGGGATGGGLGGGIGGITGATRGTTGGGTTGATRGTTGGGTTGATRGTTGGGTTGATTTTATGGTTTMNCCANNSISCLDDTRTNDAVQALAKAGIKTIVVGIPGTEAYTSILDGFAQSGGVVNPSGPPSYYAVSASAGVQGFETVLQSIAQRLIKTCLFQLVQLNMALETGSSIAVYVDDNLATEGTDYTLDITTNPPTVVLEGSTCDSVKANGAQSVDIEVFCPGVAPPPHIHVN